VKYLWYVVRHRWFVMLACFEYGLYWRGLTHDMSKFSLVELRGYMLKFGERIQAGRNKTGAYDPTSDTNELWEKAWRHHFQHNDHHWQHYATPRPDCTYKVSPMSDDAIKEMVCDWLGAGKAQGNTTTVLQWYHANKYTMCLEVWTRMAVEREIGYFIEKAKAGDYDMKEQ
jgi:hypothetical protein